MGPFDSAWLTAAIVLATPLLLAATGELYSERAGVLNVGLEGMVLMGAFFGFWGHWYFGDMWVGIAVGALAGMALAAVMALLTIGAKADQIVVGVGLSLLGSGVTTVAFRQIFSGRGEIVLPRMDRLAIPGLSDLPGIGRPLFDQTPVVYLTFLLVLVTWFVLYKTSWGLGLRAVGEVPAAADTAGVNVEARRWQALLITGAFGGVAGASLSVVQLGLFQENMSAGRGFLALAAVIFGRWRPAGVLGACLLFGAADALELRLQAERFIPREVWLVAALIAAAILVGILVRRSQQHERERGGYGGLAIAAVVAVGAAVLFGTVPELSFPSQLWLAMPFVVTLLALAGIAGRTRAPAALTIPYRREMDI